MPVPNTRIKLPTSRQAMNRSEAGFTLLELLITLVCLSVVLAIAVPGYTTFVQKIDLMNAANQLAADLRECRALAASGREACSLQFADLNSYTVTGGSRNKQVLLPPGVFIKDVKMGFGAQSVTFNQNGHPSNGGSIILQNRSQQSVKLTVHLHTGQIQMTEETE